MMTIVEFLTARLDEMEAVAQRAVGDSAHAEIDNYGRLCVPTSWVLADIATKRKIVERWEYRWREANDATEQHLNAMFASQATGLGNAVCLLAKIYADHPDYDPDWYA